MKYELKRKTSEYVFAALFAFIGIALFVIGQVIDDDELPMFGLLLSFFSIAFIVYIKIKDSGDKLLFDEHCFTVGENRYLYSQIERIKATRIKHSVIFSIYVNGEKVFSFDNGYENINEFQRVLVMHNVNFNAYGD